MTDKQRTDRLTKDLRARGIDAEAVKACVTSMNIELPSWSFADSGTRFKVFHQAGAARTVFEKIDDAARVHRLTGVTPSVALHVLWDLADADLGEVSAHADQAGVRIGAINPTLFERDEYKFGSLASPDPLARDAALAHVIESIEIMRRLGSKRLSLWLADGTNYPGQDDMIARKFRLTNALGSIHDNLDEDMELLLEYKFFEPAFYSTDVPDWGTAYLLAKKAGPRAKVLVDLGHHPQGTNVEQIVARLIDERMLGGFHLNSRKYADDDLTSGSMDPYELFLIFNELAAAAGGYGLYRTAYMIDQSHNVKPKVPAMIQSVMAIQEIAAKALCVDRDSLAVARKSCDVIAAEELLRQAFFTDVRPLLAAARVEAGLPADPLAAYNESGYQREIERARA
jgi:L-rhamnose isomerase/sugar isomerase